MAGGVAGEDAEDDEAEICPLTVMRYGAARRLTLQLRAARSGLPDAEANVHEAVAAALGSGLSGRLDPEGAYARGRASILAGRAVSRPSADTERRMVGAVLSSASRGNGRLSTGSVSLPDGPLGSAIRAARQNRRGSSAGEWGTAEPSAWAARSSRTLKLGTLDGVARRLVRVCFGQADPGRMAVAVEDGAVLLCSAEELAVTRELRPPPYMFPENQLGDVAEGEAASSPSGVARALAFSASDKLVFMVIMGEAVIWHTEEGECLFTIGRELLAASFAPSAFGDSVLVCGNADGAIQLVDCLAMWFHSDRKQGIVAERNQISRLSRGVTAIAYESCGKRLFVSDTGSTVHAFRIKRPELVEERSIRLGGFTIGYSAESVAALSYTERLAGIGRGQGQGALICLCCDRTLRVLAVAPGASPDAPLASLEQIAMISISEIDGDMFSSPRLGKPRGSVVKSAQFPAVHEIEMVMLSAGGESKRGPATAAIACRGADGGVSAATLVLRGDAVGVEAELRPVGHLDVSRQNRAPGSEGAGGAVVSAGVRGIVWASSVAGSNELFVWALMSDGAPKVGIKAPWEACGEDEDENRTSNSFHIGGLMDFLADSDEDGDDGPKPIPPLPRPTARLSSLDDFLEGIDLSAPREDGGEDAASSGSSSSHGNPFADEVKDDRIEVGVDVISADVGGITTDLPAAGLVDNTAGPVDNNGDPDSTYVASVDDYLVSESNADPFADASDFGEVEELDPQALYRARMGGSAERQSGSAWSPRFVSKSRSRLGSDRLLGTSHLATGNQAPEPPMDLDFSNPFDVDEAASPSDASFWQDAAGGSEVDGPASASFWGAGGGAEDEDGPSSASFWGSA